MSKRYRSVIADQQWTLFAMAVWKFRLNHLDFKAAIAPNMWTEYS